MGNIRKSCAKRKGYVYTLEAVLAITLMVVTFLSVFSNTPHKPELEISLIKQSGFDALDYLNREGSLREMVKNSSEAQMESRLFQMLPKSFSIETEICEAACDSTGVPGNGTVVAVDYYVSAFDENYLGKRVRLWLAKK